MPILPAEPDLFPNDLWQRAGSRFDPSGDRKWWCLHTKPRQEKATARDLRCRNIAYYLPQVVHEDRTPLGRKTRSVIPLFSSYVFLLGNHQERQLSLRANRLVRVLEVTCQESLDRDLQQIHRMLASGLAVIAEPMVPVGSRVRILNGPLAGIEGKVVKRGKRDQFVAVVQFLGSGAMVELQDWQVEQLHDGQTND